MRQNPYPEEPLSAQPTDIAPRGERMADLPPKRVPPPPTEEILPEVISTETRQEEARTVRYAISKLNDFLQWFLAVLEVTLAIRFLLHFIGADPANLFAGFLYALTDIVLFPFRDIVPSSPLAWNRPFASFEFSTLIAMAIYWMVFWALRRFLSILITGPLEEAST